MNASTFTARVVASTGADCGAALSAAVGALSGPLHGGAPAYVKPMLEEVAAMGDPEKWVRDTLDAGKRIMGFGHRVYRAEDPRSRILKQTRARARVAADRDRGAARGGGAGRARAAQAGPPAEDERRVLLGPRPRHRRGPAAARAGDVRLLARRRLVGAHPRAEAARRRLFRPSARYVGPGLRIAAGGLGSRRETARTRGRRRARARRLRLLVAHVDDRRPPRRRRRSRAPTRSSSRARRRSPTVSPCSRTARSSSR